MKALSLRQPWAWLVLNGKSIENRRWNTSFRGPFLIHAAKGMTLDEYDDVVLWLFERFGQEMADSLPEFSALDRGGIIGVAYLEAVVRPGTGDHAALLADHPDYDVRWHMAEQFGFVLRDIRPTPFIPLSGALGFFNVDDSIAQQALAGAA